MTKKDPAFLFYSKDFYEGTRTMLPEERACYLDLLIYQHQNGLIPNDIKRLLMYCSGVSEATLQATLQAKFKPTDKGWLNIKLDGVISDRSDFKNKLSINGTVGQFWKKCKVILSSKEYDSLRKALKTVDNLEIFEFIKDKEIKKSTLQATLKALLKHLAIGNAIVNVIVNEDNNSTKRFRKPKIEEIKNYCLERQNGLDPQYFFDFYESKDWKIGNNKMKDWKACVRTWEKNKKPTPQKVTFDTNR